MNHEDLERMVLRVRNSPVLSSRQRSDIENHLVAIDAHLPAVEADDPEAARGLRLFLECAIFESTRRERTNVLATAARKGMLLAFRPHEETRPELVSAVYSLGDILSALGI